MTKRISRAKEVELKLLALIDKGEWKDGRLPSETDLADFFEVSRVTVREALSSLAGMGIVQRKHGLGTFITQDWFRGTSGIQARLDEPFELGTLIERAGYEMTISVVSFNYGKAPERVARMLNISPDMETLNVHKIFYADGIPAISIRNIVPLHVPPGESTHAVRQQIDPEEQIFSLVERVFHRKTAFMISDLKPMLVTDEMAAYLDQKVGSPVLFLEEVAYSENGEPLLVALEYHVPGIINFRIKRALSYFSK